MKINDKVKVIAKVDNYGLTGYIEEIDADGDYRVGFDIPCETCGHKDYDWGFYSADEIEVVE